jgi:hypothetical protein
VHFNCAVDSMDRYGVTDSPQVSQDGGGRHTFDSNLYPSERLFSFPIPSDDSE